MIKHNETVKSLKAIGFYNDTATTESGIKAWGEALGVATPAIETSVKVLYRTDPNCDRCKTDPYVPHFNCLYHGKAIGHSAAHCTANGCY